MPPRAPARPPSMWAPVVLSMAASAAAQSLPILQNPSFEASIWLDPAWNWTCTVNANTCGVNHAGFGPGQVSSDGNNSAFIEPSCTMSQATPAVKGATYRLSFDTYAAYELRGFRQPNVQVGWASAPLAWGAGGTLLSVQNGTDTNGTTSGPYATFSWNMTAQGNDVLSFTYFPTAKASISNTSENGANIPALRLDNVTLAQVADASSSSSGGGSGMQTGLIAACAALGALALLAGIWAAIATSRLVRANKRRRNEMGVVPNPQDAAAIRWNEMSSYNASRASGRERTTSEPAESSFGATSLSKSPSQRAPEIMQEQGSWNPYEQDTYHEFPHRKR